MLSPSHTKGVGSLVDSHRRITETIYVPEQGTKIEQVPGLRVVCLDDSAYQRDVWLDDPQAMIGMREAYGPQADQAIIESVRGLYEPYRVGR